MYHAKRDSNPYINIYTKCVTISIQAFRNKSFGQVDKILPMRPTKGDYTRAASCPSVRRLYSFYKPPNQSRTSVLVSKSSIPTKKSTSRLIRAIAVFKLFKAVLLTCLGFGAFRLLNPVIGQRLTHWVGSFAWNYNRSFVLSGLTKLTGLKPTQLKALGLGAFLYAILFTVEGIGLWFEKRWAAYLTVIATGSLLPLELYELYRRTTYSRGFTLLLNFLVFIYLIIVVRRRAA